MTIPQILRKSLLLLALSVFFCLSYAQSPTWPNLPREEPFLFDNGGNYNAYPPSSSTRCQVAFGWYSDQKYAHWIGTRHHSGSGYEYKNAFDFYLWQYGDAPNELGSNHVMSITGRGLALGSGNYYVPNGYVMEAVGNILVDGNIECEKLEIKNIGADFVFDADYHLPTLWELEQYIKQNKHLPGIPTATETEQGVDLGKLTQTLLQKVEELTLYTIEQEKKIRILEQQINSMKN
ncbi:MAG: hypothetical protein JW801_17560 [Bacteroidales bacterium]|nr:hypothetical protein [Bacteroidales bacterium]